jgi:hypothetical protein
MIRSCGRPLEPLCSGKYTRCVAGSTARVCASVARKDIPSGLADVLVSAKTATTPLSAET